MAEIFHVVLLEPKSETSQEELDEALEHVRELKGKIPGITSIHAGPNQNSMNSKGYSYGFIIHFIDEGSFRAYAPHPAHQPVSQELQNVCSRIIDFDLPFEEK